MKIAILGAGLGGLTLAQCLKNKNISFDLYESFPEIKPVGAGIWVPPNAMQVLAHLGLDQDILNKGVPLDRMNIVDSSLKPLSHIDGKLLATQYHFPTVSIQRHDLHSILVHSLPADCLHLDFTCEKIQIQQSSVNLLFKNGLQANYDLVVAADGIHSIGRKALGDHRPLIYSGQTCLRGLTDMELPQDLLHQSFEIWGEGVRFGFSAVNAHQVYWYAPFVHPAKQKYSAHERLQLLQQNYRNFPSIVQDIIKATLPENIIHTDLFELSPVPLSDNGLFGSSQVLLLGDSAHAMTPNLGQGAAMAIEDAFVLGELLARCKSSPEAVLDAYSKARSHRVAKIANWSAQLGRLASWQNPLACKIRNGLLAHLPDFLQRRQIEFIYKGI